MRVSGVKKVTFDVQAYSNVWFYANPIFIRPQGSPKLLVEIECGPRKAKLSPADNDRATITDTIRFGNDHDDQNMVTIWRVRDNSAPPDSVMQNSDMASRSAIALAFDLNGCISLPG